MNTKLLLPVVLMIGAMAFSPVSAQNPSKKQNSTRNPFPHHRPTTPQNARGDVKMRLDSQLFYFKNGTKWQPESKWAYSFNQDGFLKDQVAMYRINGAKWDSSYISKYSFNSNGQVISVLSSNFSDSAGAWLDDIVEWYEYNNDGLLILEADSSYNYGTKKWDLGDEVSYEYEDGVMIKKSNSRYNPDTKKWVNYSYTEYRYNSGNILESETEYQLDFNNVMKEYFRNENIITSNQIIRTNNYAWNFDSLKWSKYGFIEFEFDANGNEISEEYAYLIEGKWLRLSRFLFDYDPSFGLSDLIIPPVEHFLPYQTDKIKNLYKGYVSQGNSGNNWADQSKSELFYTSVDVGSMEVPPSDVPILVTSGQGAIDIQFLEPIENSDWTIYDLAGKVIQSGSQGSLLSTNIPVAISGIYLWEVRTTNERFSGKVVVR